MTEGKAKPKRGKTAAKAQPQPETSAGEEAWFEEVQGLSYQEASTALELALSQLQTSDLEVEQMAGLYRRAKAYAARCEALLAVVEQEVIEWETKGS
ncbi:MAG: exodeoxyribonuclease small subunit [Cyanobacteriota bacterium]